jgi:predicted nucleic acid-binding protein
VTRFLLDTNIVSEASKPQPSAAIADWVQSQADGDLFISTLTIAEIWRGVLEMSSGRRRRNLETWFAGAEGPSALFLGRVLSFDERAAIEWARIMAAGTATGRPRSPVDMIIAATAAANNCVVVTANKRHFRGVVECFNPVRTPR